MFRILRVETNTLYPDVYESQIDAVEMAKMFIADDEEYNEPEYTYAVVKVLEEICRNK